MKSAIKKKVNVELALLREYRTKCMIVSSAKVYETDREVAEAIKDMPCDKESTKRYRSYVFAVK